MQLSNGQKFKKEIRKAKSFYITAVILSMLISVGGIFLAKIGSNPMLGFMDMFRSVSLINIFGWLLGVCGAIGAVVISRRSKGTFVFTNKEIGYFGVDSKSNWDLKRSLISEYQVSRSWFERITGCCTLVLKIENQKGGKDALFIGPLNRRVAEEVLAALGESLPYYINKR